MNHRENALISSPYFTNIQQSIEQLGRRNRNILVYYGESALTSQLSRALHNQLRKQGQLCAFVDGVGLKENTASPMEKGPALLRSALKGGIDFSCYDIAHWCYWSAVNPELAIDSVEFSKKMSRADKISTFADLVGAGQALDFSDVLKQMDLTDISATARSLIPEMMNDVAKLIEGAIPFGVFAAKLAWFFVGLDERRRIWWRERGNEDLREIKTECGRPFDVLPLIPLFLARDLKQHFRQTDLSKGKQAAVVLVDGYEYLVDGKQQAGRCSWIESMISRAESSPYILWVITAEHPLEWMEDAQQVAVVPTVEDDSALIRSVVAVPDSWSGQKRQLFEVMAIPQYWNETLLTLLATQFLPQKSDGEELNENFLKEKLATLIESPYVLALGDGTWRWQREMRAYLLANQSSAMQKQVHNYLFEYYQELAANTAKEISALKEALYHGLKSTRPEIAIDWFLAAVLSAIEQRPHPALPEIVGSLIDDSSLLSLKQTALAYTRLGQALSAVYEWSEAEYALEAALRHFKTIEKTLSEFQKDHSEVEDNCLEVRENQLGMAQIWYSLAEVYLAQENSFDSLKSAQMAARMWNKLLGENSLPYAQALRQQGSAYFSQGRRPDARRVSKQAVEIATALPNITTSQLSEFKWVATNVCCHVDSLDEAESRCLDMLQFSVQLPGEEEHELSIRSVALLGDIYSYMGKSKWQQAFDCYQQTIDRSRSVWGSGNDYAIAALDAQIRLCNKLGQQDLADKLSAQREQATQADQFENAIEVAFSKNELAGALYEKAQYGKAEVLFKQALALNQKILGDCHPKVAFSLSNLVLVYLRQGRYEKAESLQLRALEIQRQTLGDYHPELLRSLNNLANVYIKQGGRYQEAETLLRQVLLLDQKQAGNTPFMVVTALGSLAGIYRDQGRYQEAEPLLQKALLMRQQNLGKSHPDVALSLNNLAGLYENQGRYNEAEPLHIQALEIRRKILGNNHPDTVDSLNNLAILYDKQERYSEAERLYKESLLLRQHVLGTEHPMTAQSLSNLGSFYFNRGRYSEARPLLEEALSIYRRGLGNDHPSTQIIVRILQRLRELL